MIKIDNIKNIDMGKIKKGTLVIIGIIIFSFSLCNMIIKPINETKKIYKEIKQNERKKEEKQNDYVMAKKISTKRIEENENDSEVYRELLESYSKISFENVGTFEKFIEKTAGANNIVIQTVGSIERRKEEISNDVDRIYCPYILSGNEYDMENFLKEIENSEHIIRIMDSGISVEKKDDRTILNFKIGTNIYNNDDNDTEEDKPEEDEEEDNEDNGDKDKYNNIFTLNQVMENILRYEIIQINNKKYVVIRSKNKKKYVLKDGEETTIKNILYKVRIIADRIYLEK